MQTTQVHHLGCCYVLLIANSYELLTRIYWCRIHRSRNHWGSRSWVQWLRCRGGRCWCNVTSWVTIHFRIGFSHRLLHRSQFLRVLVERCWLDVVWLILEIIRGRQSHAAYPGLATDTGREHATCQTEGNHHSSQARHPSSPTKCCPCLTHQAGRAASTPPQYRLGAWEAFNEFVESPHNTGCNPKRTCYDVATW